MDADSALNICHLSTYANIGGAGKAAYRIHRQLLQKKIASTFLCSKKHLTDEHTHLVHPQWTGGLVHKVVGRWDRLPLNSCDQHTRANFSLNRSFHWSPQQHRAVKNAHVLALYWIGDGFLHPSQLTHLQKPIVWRLSDTWPFTGGCHYPGPCTLYREQCQQCPQMPEASLQKEIAHRWQVKEKSWRDLPMTVVCPSQWIYQCAQKSTLLGGKNLKLIPTGVDTSVFYPQDQTQLRTQLGLPLDHQIVLFGALKNQDDPRKGWQELRTILPALGSEKKLFGLVMGQLDKDQMPPLPFDYQSLGHIEDTAQLAKYYNCADVFLAPSLEENLANTVLESLACGTPVVAFAIGGMPDAIVPGQTGLLATAYDCQAFARAVLRVLEQPSMRPACRRLIEEKFSLKHSVDQLVKLYESVVQT